MDDKRVLILGCTASGKGALAFELARRWAGQILSIDSMKVYRRMDIGTAKPTTEQRSEVKYHLIDVVEPSEQFSLGKYIELANEAIEGMEHAGPIIAVGGTALYIKGLLDGLFEGPAACEEIRQRLRGQAAEEGSGKLHEHLRRVDPAAAQRIHPNDLKRIIRALEVYELTGSAISDFQEQFCSGRHEGAWELIGLRRSVADNNRRINRRVRRMVELGLLGEVERLLAEPAGLSEQAAQAVGYAEMIGHLQGMFTLDEAVEKIKVNTRRLGKSQRTWFRRFQAVNWFDVGLDETPEQLTNRVAAYCQERQGQDG